MAKPEEAGRSLTEHFSQITLEEFQDRYEKYAGDNGSPQLPAIPDRGSRDVILRQREPAALKLQAYLASALTGLDEEQRAHMTDVAEVVAAVCEDTEIDLYEPWKSTDPIKHPNVSPEDVFDMDREHVLGSDLVIHIADYASTGAGEELDFALDALIPIILLSHGDSVVSRMVLGIPALKLKVTYTTLDELRVELKERLTEIRPILEERKLSFSGFDTNIVGNKVRLLREDAQITREELAASSKGLLTAERIRGIEENTDKMSNPSLLQLRALAACLKTTVADLVEPDLQERVLVMLQEWLGDKVAARTPMSENDRNKILTRTLARFIHDLNRD